MIVDEITRDDVITVLEHVQATCALNDDFGHKCPYADHDNCSGCVLAHIPKFWQIDKIGGDQDEIN